MYKFIDLTRDFGFKIVMMDPECPELMLGFLNAIIPERRIVSVEFLNTEILPPDEENKRSNYDIQCIDGDGNVFVVEMQKRSYRHFPDRMVVYSGDPLTRLLRKGEDYDKVRTLYVIGILDGYLTLEEEPEPVKTALVRRASLKMNDSGKPLSDKINYIYLQLPAAGKLTRESSFLERWAWHVRNVGKASAIPEGLDDYFRLLYTHADRRNIREGKLSIYDKMVRDEIQIKAENDFAIEMALKEAAKEAEAREAKAEARARAEGKAEGKTEGKQEEKRAVAKALKTKGFSVSDISEVTGLSIKEIEAL